MKRQRIINTSFCKDEHCKGHESVTYGPPGKVLVMTNDPQLPFTWGEA